MLDLFGRLSYSWAWLRDHVGQFSQVRGHLTGVGVTSHHLHPSKVQVKPKEHSEIWAFNASYANLIEN